MLTSVAGAAPASPVPWRRPVSRSLNNRRHDSRWRRPALGYRTILSRGVARHVNHCARGPHRCKPLRVCQNERGRRALAAPVRITSEGTRRRGEVSMNRDPCSFRPMRAARSIRSNPGFRPGKTVVVGERRRANLIIRCSAAKSLAAGRSPSSVGAGPSSCFCRVRCASWSWRWARRNCRAVLQATATVAAAPIAASSPVGISTLGRSGVCEQRQHGSGSEDARSHHVGGRGGYGGGTVLSQLRPLFGNSMAAKAWPIADAAVPHRRPGKSVRLGHRLRAGTHQPRLWRSLSML